MFDFHEQCTMGAQTSEPKWLLVKTMYAIDWDCMIKFIKNIFIEYSGLNTQKPSPFCRWVLGSFFIKGIQIYPFLDQFTLFRPAKKLKLKICTQQAGPKRVCAICTKLWSTHHFKGLSKGCVLCTGASCTCKITVYSLHKLYVWLMKYLDKLYISLS